MGGQAAGLGDELRVAPGVVDGRGDLPAVSDDARIGHEASDVVLPELGDGAGLEVGKGCTEVLALAKDGQPAEARLEALQAQLLEQAPVIGDRSPPLRVVVRPVERVVAGPPAPGAVIGAFENSLGGMHGA